MIHHKIALIFNIAIAVWRVRHVTSAPRKAAEHFTPVDLCYRVEDGIKRALAG